MRRDLYPDERPAKTWLQWKIELVVALWPCCIREWRKWAFGLLIVGGLGAIGFGVVKGCRIFGWGGGGCGGGGIPRLASRWGWSLRRGRATRVEVGGGLDRCGCLLLGIDNVIMGVDAG